MEAVAAVTIIPAAALPMVAVVTAAKRWSWTAGKIRLRVAGFFLLLYYIKKEPVMTVTGSLLLFLSYDN